MAHQVQKEVYKVLVLLLPLLHRVPLLHHHQAPGHRHLVLDQYFQARALLLLLPPLHQVLRQSHHQARDRRHQAQRLQARALLLPPLHRMQHLHHHQAPGRRHLVQAQRLLVQEHCHLVQALVPLR